MPNDDLAQHTQHQQNIKDNETRVDAYRENIILENTEEAIIAFINKLPEQYIQKIAFHPRIINAREQGNGSLGYDMETNKAEKDVGTDGNVVEQTLLLDQIAIKNGGQVQTPTKQSFHTNGALYPLRILQLCGFFPISIYRRDTLSLTLRYSSWYRSPAAIWLIALILSSIGPMVAALFLAVNRFKTSISGFVNQGRNTFLVLNVTWGAGSVICPLISRISLLQDRKRLISFWEQFCKLCGKFKKFTNFRRGRKHAKNLKLRWALHFVTQLVNSSVESWIYISYGLKGAGAWDGIGLLGSLQDWAFSINAILSCFAFHGMIYFVTSYEFLLDELLLELKSEKENYHDKISNLVKDYISLDENVSEFSEMFATFLNAQVFHSFVSASGLEQKSKKFCKMVKYSGSDDDKVMGIKAKIALARWSEIEEACKFKVEDQSSLRVTLEPLSIANSVLTLNLKLFASMIAGISTYLVVIVQFHSGDPS
ncbi:hypothetical protein Fcan01_01138 [Folsomia candida]|uniref:Gustatory receptor n=1 Tax=Folsomia candida TaxID=158441 RepID=A0A226F6V5_FOLCA|nr:hypothetical protein Fcan01_01138 [Folsomia candida]